MKRLLILIVILAAVVPLAACDKLGIGGSSESADVAPEASARGLPMSTQLLMGTFKLEDTDNAVDADQAKQLLVLWKGLKTLAGSDSVSPAEVQGLEKQIEATMTEAQRQAIEEMGLQMEDMAGIMAELGIEFGGAGGRMADMTEEERAALQAQREAGGGFGGGEGRLLRDAHGGGGGGAFGGPGGGGMNPEQIQTIQAVRAASGGGARIAVPSVLIDALIELLQNKV